MRIFLSCGLGLALLGALAVEATAQSSCSAQYQLCLSRGGGTACSGRLASCKRSGCFNHIAKYGGPMCGLKKS